MRDGTRRQRSTSRSSRRSVRSRIASSDTHRSRLNCPVGRKRTRQRLNGGLVIHDVASFRTSRSNLGWTLLTDTISGQGSLLRQSQEIIISDTSITCSRTSAQRIRGTMTISSSGWLELSKPLALLLWLFLFFWASAEPVNLFMQITSVLSLSLIATLYLISRSLRGSSTRISALASMSLPRKPSIYEISVTSLS